MIKEFKLEMAPKEASSNYNAPINCFRDGVEGGRPPGIDRANSPQGRRFDRQLYPASGTIDNPREN